MRDRARRRQLSGLRQGGFTLIELLAVCGILSVLTALLLPATATARREARALRCQNNIRQIAFAISAYVGEYKHKYPPNTSAPSPGQWWHDPGRVGAYLPPLPIGIAPDEHAVWVCPDDESARRSYSMNYWASSKVDAVPVAPNGTRWGPQTKNASKLLLLAESWSYTGSAPAGFSAQPFIGIPGSGGQRFGGGGGLTPYPAGRFGMVNCELTFARHRRSGGSGSGTQPRGRVVIAFADTHVEMLSDEAFVAGDPAATLTGLCAFSPFDWR
jgi:prepilin-type N-terminal cleavage/methylation domain-containing protein